MLKNRIAYQRRRFTLCFLMLLLVSTLWPLDRATVSATAPGRMQTTAACTPTVTGDRAGEGSTTHRLAYDGSVTTFFNSSYSNWQYIQIDFGCVGAFSALRRHMARGNGATNDNRGAQGEGVAYSSDGIAWTDLTSQTTTGWQTYINYGANLQAWHTVTYGWSAWLSLNTPVQARYVRFRWDDNFDVVNEIETRFSPPGNPVTLAMPTDPLFVGSYAYIPVQINAASGLTLDDLQFAVEPGPQAGIVSISPERLSVFDEPTILLGAGYEPGAGYKLIARAAATGAVVGEGEFAVTALWQHPTEGPSFWFTGATGGMTMNSYAWGGGPNGPQNINVAPAVGTRKIAVVLVDSPTELFDPKEIPAVLQQWRNEIVDGVTGADGKVRSVAHYYREISHFNNGPSGLNLEADFFGPITMPATWDNYFDSSGAPFGSTYQSLVMQADPQVDYSQYKHVIFASKSVPNWPRADWGPPTYTTAEGNLSFGVVTMPYNWDVLDRNGGGRQIHDTAAHELGHNLGLGDLYTPPSDRNIGAWELMDSSRGLPHVSLVHRMILGWIPASWVQSFNFAEEARPISQTVELQPVELANPPGNRKAGVEVRLADGWNYYFEYRAAQPNQIGDGAIPENNRVLGTDVASYAVYGTFEPPRPPILLLPTNNGDGAVLAAGETYREVDVSNPTWPSDFVASVQTISADKADLHISYDINSKPDPSIRPWPAGPDREWQSPDIEVRNARNAQDPAWFNVPHAGNPNTVVARITNRGAINAPAVRVSFSVLDFTLGNAAPEISLGSDVRDVPAGASVEFFAPDQWIVADETHHYCVKVRIDPYQVPNTTVGEMTDLNNLAQSNYWRFISRTGSPSSRETSEVTVNNPYRNPAIVEIMPTQSNPLYRTYLQHRWVRLDPGEQRKIRILFEYAGDDFLAGGGSGRVFEEFRHVANQVSFRAIIRELDPAGSPEAAPVVLGGAQAAISEARATLFDRFAVADAGAEGIQISGAVVIKHDRSPAPDGTIILSFIQDGKAFNHIVPLRNGAFVTFVTETAWSEVQAYYLPPPQTADSYSEKVKNPRPAASQAKADDSPAFQLFLPLVQQ